MGIQRNATAGSLESCDCLVIASPAKTLEIRLESTVEQRFGAHIRGLVEETLRQAGVGSGRIAVTDRGALDYCIRARVITAARRGGAPC